MRLLHNIGSTLAAMTLFALNSIVAPQQVGATLQATTTTASSVCQSPQFQGLAPTPLGASPLTIRALIQGDQACLEFALSPSAPAGIAWFAVGLAQTAAMVNTPASNVMIYQAAVGKPESYYIEGYSSSAVTKEPDQSFFAIHETSKAPLRFSYQRTLAAKSPHDVVIDPTKMAQFIWAYGSSWPITGHRSGTRGTETYNFLTGASAAAESPFCSTRNCPVVVGSAAFGLMLVGGILLSTIMARTRVGRFFLHRGLVAPPVKQTTNAPIQGPLTMVLQNLADLRVGELIIVFVFAGAVAALVLLNNNQSQQIKSGQVVLLMMMFMILPVARIPLWTLTFGASFERIVKFHRWLGMAATVASVVHLIYSLKVTSILNSAEYGRVIPLWGFVAFVSLLLIGCTANEIVRRKFFNVFYFSHRALSIMVPVFTILHAPKTVLIALIVPLGLYVVGLLIRWIKSFTASHTATVVTQCSTKTTTLVLNPTDKTRGFAKTMEPCSYFWVQVPTVSAFEWHPFSAVVTPQGDSIGFCIRAVGSGGSFTRRVFDASSKQPVTTMQIRLCGPFGKPSVDLDAYDVVILIGGGVGITPLLSAINQRQSLESKPTFTAATKTQSEWNLVWAVRHKEDLLMADALMASNNDADNAEVGTAILPILGDRNVQQDAYQQTHEAAQSSTRVSWHCHCSAETSDGYIKHESGGSLRFRSGKPVLEEYINSGRYVGRRVAVLACGPPTMTVEAQALARECGFDFHKEVFGW